MEQTNAEKKEPHFVNNIFHHFLPFNMSWQHGFPSQPLLKKDRRGGCHNEKVLPATLIHLNGRPVAMHPSATK
jgi:hypothetical protein